MNIINVTGCDLAQLEYLPDVLVLHDQIMLYQESALGSKPSEVFI